MTAELVLEAGACASGLGLDEALDDRAMLEQSWCPAGTARMSRGCGFHVELHRRRGAVRQSLARVNSPDGRRRAPLGAPFEAGSGDV